jgi:hypothetical protein
MPTECSSASRPPSFYRLLGVETIVGACALLLRRMLRRVLTSNSGLSPNLRERKNSLLLLSEVSFPH